MHSKWMDRLNTARAWFFATAFIAAGAIWLVKR